MRTESEIKRQECEERLGRLRQRRRVLASELDALDARIRETTAELRALRGCKEEVPDA